MCVCLFVCSFVCVCVCVRYLSRCPLSSNTRFEFVDHEEDSDEDLCSDVDENNDSAVVRGASCLL